MIKDRYPDEGPEYGQYLGKANRRCPRNDEMLFKYRLEHVRLRYMAKFTRDRSYKHCWSAIQQGKYLYSFHWIKLKKIMYQNVMKICVRNVSYQRVHRDWSPYTNKMTNETLWIESTRRMGDELRVVEPKSLFRHEGAKSKESSNKLGEFERPHPKWADQGPVRDTSSGYLSGSG